MKIFVVSGSLNKESKTKIIAELMSSIAKEYKLELAIWDLSEKTILPQTSAHQNQTTAALFLEQLKEADAVVFATPQYQGSYSGLIKIAIDHIPKSGLENTPVGLVCVSGGMRKISQPLSHLREVVQSLGGLPVSTELNLYADDFIDGIPNKQTQQRCGQIIEELYVYNSLNQTAREKGFYG